MTIEIQFNSVMVSQDEIQEHLPNLISAVNYYFPKQKTTRRRQRRIKKKAVSVLIDDIIDSIE